MQRKLNLKRLDLDEFNFLTAKRSLFALEYSASHFARRNMS